MKKVIFILITFVLAFFVFNNRALAVIANKDATVTCTYSFPSDYQIGYKSVTFTFANNDLTSKTCNVNNSPVQNLTYKEIYNCDIDENITRDYFFDNKTGEVSCPSSLYFSYKYTSTGTAVRDYQVSWYPITVGFWEKIGAVFNTGRMLLTSSKINQGTQTATESEEGNYLQCLCGDLLLKKGQTIVFPKYPYYSTYGFSTDSLTACPKELYYKVNFPGAFSTKEGTIEIRTSEFEDSQTLACTTTATAEKNYAGSSKNPTNYIEHEDVIKSFCEETIKIWKIVGYLVNALKIMVPVIIIVMGSIDLGKAVVAQSEDDIKKGTQLLIKRLIAGIIIFFIPTIVTIVLKMASKYSATISGNSACIECVSKPGGC